MSAVVEPKQALLAAQQAVAAARAAGASEATATFTASREGYLRFAANNPTTSGDLERRRLSLEVSVGRRHASGTTEDTSRAGVQRAAEEAVARAKAAPEDPEYLPVAGPQRYAAIPFAYDPAAASGEPRARAALARVVLEKAEAANLVAAGFLSAYTEELTRLSSTGQQGTHRATRCQLTTTVRRPDGSGSGYAGAVRVRLADLDAAAIAARAVGDAQAWHDPQELPPGRYTVVLTPMALDPLLGYFYEALDARATEEGRTALAKPGGTRVGEALFSPAVTVLSDPLDRNGPGQPWGEAGLPAERHAFVEKGVLKELDRSRYWAKQTGKPPTITAGNHTLVGAGRSLAELLRGVKRGLLVSHIWYVRSLDPQQLSVTGLTRDATFLVEDGKVTRPVKNFRFNVSMLEVLKNVEDTGVAELVPESGVAPAVRVRDFFMSSVSEAV